MKIVFAGATDVGSKRNYNEDAFLIDEEWRACGVADGAGGIRGGETASNEGLAQVIVALEDARAQLRMATTTVLGRMLVRGVESANQHIIARADADPILKGMGTTMTAAIFGAGSAFIAHVGDTRAYLWREGELTQLTEDHSLINDMLRLGKITPEEAAVSPFKTIITRALGYQPSLDVDAVRLKLAGGDRLLFATDGLWREVPDHELTELLDNADPRAATSALIARAIKHGAPDNIAVVVAHIERP